jgi:hypothetical protein
LEWISKSVLSCIIFIGLAPGQTDTRPILNRCHDCGTELIINMRLKEHLELFWKGFLTCRKKKLIVISLIKNFIYIICVEGVQLVAKKSEPKFLERLKNGDISLWVGWCLAGWLTGFLFHVLHIAVKKDGKYILTGLNSFNIKTAGKQATNAQKTSDLK